MGELLNLVDPLLLVTSILGLVWNLCAVPAYELPKVGIEGPFPALVAVGFCALGFPSLSIRAAPGEGTTVEVRLPAQSKALLGAA
jgi:hypothetical protein